MGCGSLDLEEEVGRCKIKKGTAPWLKDGNELMRLRPCEEDILYCLCPRQAMHLSATKADYVYLSLHRLANNPRSCQFFFQDFRNK